ncbi:TetR/AcrR family transcriptional regulator [Methyloceanibacter sp.]|uniref:TetR/AcrR family transcriptional regulator n=1 Tax=Methyloceanibacter sp. TaxID=1965321 RepID=UPI002C129B71|nr:TetR/AcrR family transcriptional regulator [Methyloceanibacter sp.]HML90798.1 TetR/AcrR family transcriptional regulator [Methyloceanibacter sp.]
MRKVGRPRQLGEARDTAETLKKSALDLLSRNSYRSVTIKDIGREAGLTTAMIYYHFRDKNDLLRATIEYAIETALTRFQRVTENVEHPAALIHEWLYMHVSLHSEIGKVLKLIIDYNHSDVQTDRIDEAVQRFYGTERDVLMDCVQRGRDMGIFADGNPEEISVMVSTFLDGAVLRNQILGEYNIQASVEAFERVLWSALGFRGTIE